MVLLEPLEIMVGNDDSVVRDKAILSLMKVGNLLDHDSHLQTQYLPLLERLQKGDLFAQRIAACHLYADIYSRFQIPEVQDLIRRKIQELGEDDTPMVRRGAAHCIPKIAKCLNTQQAKDFLLPLIKRLLDDTNDSVKIYAISSSVDVAKCLKDQTLFR